MQALIQRVTEAEVRIDGEPLSRIGHGLVALVSVLKDDDDSKSTRLAERLLSFRVFPDNDASAESKDGAKRSSPMKRNVLDVGGEILLIPQFTIGADVRKGTRASFHPLADPQLANTLFDDLCRRLEERIRIGRGVFGAHMSVMLVNDGPVTFLLSS